MIQRLGEILVGPGDGDGIADAFDKSTGRAEPFGRCKPEPLRFRAVTVVCHSAPRRPPVARNPRKRELRKRRRWLAPSGNSRPSRGITQALVDTNSVLPPASC